MHKGRRWLIPDALATRAIEDDQWPRYRARLENEAYLAWKAEQQRLADEEAARVAAQQKIDKVWDEAVRINDCFDAHDGTHPWVLRIEGPGWEVLCPMCRAPWTPGSYDDWQESAGSTDIPINPSFTSTVYHTSEGSDWEFEVTFQLPYGIHKRPAHKHVWHYEWNGAHSCYLCGLNHPPKCALRTCWHPHFTDESIPLPRPRPEQEYLEWTL